MNMGKIVLSGIVKNSSGKYVLKLKGDINSIRRLKNKLYRELDDVEWERGYFDK